MNAKEMAQRIYLRTIGVVKGVFHELDTRNRISARRVKRAVQQMIESLDSNPDYLLNLSTLKNYDEYTFNHSVNVSVLAIALGRHMGLSRRDLYTIGQAGMLHDLGKLCVPKAILNKPGRLLPEEREIVGQHPIDGFVSIASQLGTSANTLDVALAAYEHHLNDDGTGYPSGADAYRKGFFSRIISIVDRYDAMTSARVYRGEPFSPPKALAILHHSHAAHHDPLMLRFFLNLMGYYPLGTAVLLTDRSVAVVVRAARDPELRHLPVVRLILDEDGTPASDITIDLAATAKDSEPLGVMRVISAGDYGIEPMDYIL
jgi:HD-GYP domain-containing protein (c-di-GMP phosphodiesterase class II)